MVTEYSSPCSQQHTAGISREFLHFRPHPSLLQDMLYPTIYT